MSITDIMGFSLRDAFTAKNTLKSKNYAQSMNDIQQKSISVAQNNIINQFKWN